MKTLCVSLLALLLTGCYVDTSVTLRNRTQGAVEVRSSNVAPWERVKLQPGKAKRIPGAGGAHGDIFVTTDTGKELQFRDVNLVTVDARYLEQGNYVLVGAGYMILNVMLETNDCLYALTPGKKAVDSEIPQPTGYPKTGRELNQRP